MGVGVLAVLAAPREERHAIRPIQTEGLQPAPAREALEWIVRLALLLAGALVLGRVWQRMPIPHACSAPRARPAQPKPFWRPGRQPPVSVHLAAVVAGFGVIILAATPFPGGATRPGVVCCRRWAIPA